MEERFRQFSRERQFIRNVSPRTLEAYQWAWKAFSPALAGRDSITKSDVLLRIEELRTSGLSPVTINTYVRSVNAFCRWLFEEGHAPTLLRIPRLKEEQKVLATMTPAHVSRLVAFRAVTWTDKRIQMLACLILDTGLRIDEALSLRRTDLDLEQATVTVRNGKGGKSRIIPLSHQMRKLLFRFIQAHQPKYGDWLFYADAGEQMGQRNALRDFKQLCSKLEIGGVRCSFHTLRHSFALGYVRNGGDVFRLQRILGHAKLEMSRRYVNLSLGDLQEVHQRLSLFANTGR